ncbi:6-aminohexanoate hydrolase [Marinisporobacter balticus]|uniref:Uncharacterized protein n=1 Tax=Marinisporobacter balticus TaxID=2018667 RepID=A0A4R2KNE2_9FIRM|nr:6-aminohexanoate hydrolase [Marinisporobacter balticus]TCO68095.1 hypothetical protein EV214_1486 [Marinisporobacter balticus]
MIDILDKWMDSSVYNFNIFVGITTILAIISIIAMFYFYKQIGKPDERTSIIYLKVSTTMFSTLVCAIAVYISWVDSNIIYFRQYLLFIFSISLLAGAIMSAIQYKKDFS